MTRECPQVGGVRLTDGKKKQRRPSDGQRAPELKRRPGAPPGNLNALKTGLHSKQFAAIGRQLASDPKTLDKLMELNRRLELRQRRSNEVTALLLTLFIERVRKMAGGDLNWDFPVDDLNSIRRAASQISGTAFEDLPGRDIFAENNAESRTNGENQPLL